MNAYRLVLSTMLFALGVPALAADLPRVKKVDLQPLAQQVRRLHQALKLLGEPLSRAEVDALNKANRDKEKGVEAIQGILDKRCLFGIHIAPTDRPNTIVCGSRRGQPGRTWPSKVGGSFSSRCTIRLNSPV